MRSHSIYFRSLEPIPPYEVPAMTKIKKYVDQISEELSDAKEYMEIALEYKAANDATRYAKYKELSIQELSHAAAIHEFAVQDIDRLRDIYPDIPQKMQERWDKAHVEYVEKAAWIKQMQTM